MRDNAVKRKSYALALRIIGVNKFLVEKREYVLSKQILRSGTSIGANIEEADAGISRADFSAKLSISYKEAKETQYWLRLLHDSGYIDRALFESLTADVNEVCKLLYAILKSSGRIRVKNGQ